MKEIDIKMILLSMFCKGHQSGEKLISLKEQDMTDYVSRLENFFNMLNIDFACYSDYFTKTPVSETYDVFKDFLIQNILAFGLGDFNNDYSSLIIRASDKQIEAIFKQVKEYETITELGASIIAGITIKPAVMKQWIEEINVELKQQESVKVYQNRNSF